MVRNNEEHADLAAKALAYQKLSKSTNTADEAVAHFVELASNAGIKPTEGAAKFFKPLMDWAKGVLAKFGFGAGKLTAQDIIDMARGAARKALEGRFQAKPGAVEYSNTPKYATSDDPELQRIDRAVVKQPTPWAKKMHDWSLGFRAQGIDSKDMLEKLSQQMGEKHAATQMMYLVRQAEHKANYIRNLIAEGPMFVKKITRSNGTDGYVLDNNRGASLIAINKVLGRVEGIGNMPAVLNRFKVYLTAKRAAGRPDGYKELLGHDVTPEQIADLKKVEAYGDSNPLFKEAREMHRQFSDGLIDFPVQTGAISEELGAKLKEGGDYVSYYRENGDALDLWVNNERIGTVGNLKTQPWLRELIGGDTQVTGYNEGVIRNAHMLTEMALSNLGTKSVAETLHDWGLATIGSGDGPKGGMYKNVLQFKAHGEPKFAVLNVEALDEKGTPAELIVRGMEGMVTQMPAIIRALGIPAQLFRHFILRNPAFAFKSMTRDAGQNYLIDGMSGVPVLSQINAARRLIADPELLSQMGSKGLRGGQVLTGGIEDQKTILNDLATGKMGLTSGLA